MLRGRRALLDFFWERWQPTVYGGHVTRRRSQLPIPTVLEFLRELLGVTEFCAASLNSNQAVTVFHQPSKLAGLSELTETFEK